MSTYEYETYHYYKEHGICVRCKREDAAKGKVMCLNCASIVAEQVRARLNKKSDEERAELNRKKRERAKKLRDYRREHGLCLDCGKPKYKNYCVCYECYIKKKRMDRKKCAKQNKGYLELGLCRICGKPVVKDKKYCEEHLEQYRELMRRNSYTVNKERYESERNKYGALQK